MRTSTGRKDARATEHTEAAALVHETGARLGLSLDYLRDLTKRVTGRPWVKLDAAGADATCELLAVALHRTLNRAPALAC